MSTDIFIGVGSNIDPETHIALSIAELNERIGLIETSGIFRNPPVGFEGDDFLNLVLRLRTRLTPQEIEEILNEIECRAGRVRDGEGPGPRSLDLDLLLYGSLVDADLRLPHPDILNYAFVLCPLAELVPDLVHPITGIPLSESWAVMKRDEPRLDRVDLDLASLRVAAKDG
ncbi:MAG: 2-amino-4-hydroxy-6-hydroxymethyldihydropteridine diphosphokinase [Gammaproteobacteria bacterium]